MVGKLKKTLFQFAISLVVFGSISKTIPNDLGGQMKHVQSENDEYVETENRITGDMPPMITAGNVEKYSGGYGKVFWREMPASAHAEDGLYDGWP